MGENTAKRAEEIETLRLGLELGVTLIDTAEMYGEGRTEELVGEALEHRRDQAFIVSKVYPHNASRSGAIAACDRSLRRLRTDRIDLYLLHWQGSVPLEETIDAFITLQRDGKVKCYGVSNFDVDDMEELWRVPGGSATATNQVSTTLSAAALNGIFCHGCARGVCPLSRIHRSSRADSRMRSGLQLLHVSPACPPLRSHWLGCFPAMTSS